MRRKLGEVCQATEPGGGTPGPAPGPAPVAAAFLWRARRTSAQIRAAMAITTAAMRPMRSAVFELLALFAAGVVGSGGPEAWVTVKSGPKKMPAFSSTPLREMRQVAA